MADQQTVFRSVSSYPSKIKILFSNGKEPLIEDFGTPEWISELSTIVDEVRDRTILVKINSPLHSWSDSRISLLFSEIGEVEKVKHLPPRSGFHFQVRFMSSYDSEWAYCYFNGTFLHQGCCELEICRADDLVTWNVQRVAAIKVAFGIRNTPGTKKDDSLLEEVNQIEDTTKVLRKNELDVVKEPSDFSACQVLDKMPKSWLNDIAVINEELVDGIDWEATPMGSVERLDDVKALEEGKTRDAIRTIFALKLPTGFIEQESMMNGVAAGICFDPGGVDLTHADLAISLPNGNQESDVNEEKELIQMESNGTILVEETSDVAHHMLDKMPSKETGLHDEFLSDNVDLNHHTSDVGALVAVQRTLDEKLDCLRISKVVDMSTNGISNDLIGAEHKLKVVVEHELQVAAEYELKVVAEHDAIEVFKEEMTMVHKGIRSFDPGGLVMSNAIGSLMASAEISYSGCVEKMMFDLGGSVDEFSALLEDYDGEVHTYFCWSVGRVWVKSSFDHTIVAGLLDCLRIFLPYPLNRSLT